MTSFAGIARGLGGHAVIVASILIFIGQTYAVLQAFRQRRGWRCCAPAVGHLILCTALVILLLDGIFMGRYSDIRLTWPAPVTALFALPWPAVVGLELLCALGALAYRLSNRRYEKTRLTPDAIKNTLDLLPVAICFADGSGRVVMANIRMSELNRTLTGRALYDAGTLWTAVTERGEERNGRRLVCLDDGTALLFDRGPVTVDGRDYDQITAADVTDEYRITEELRAKNKRLRDVQYRMKAVSARDVALLIPREIMQARMAVHDHMGNLLLTVKNYLDDPEALSEAEILRLLQYNNRFLLGEAEEPEPPADPVDEALDLARHIGVTVELTGALPTGENTRALLGQAIEQCAANTVRHAAGDRLTVAVTESADAFRAVFTNNGAAPEKPVAETGGLATLRQQVEAAGGTMAVESAPVFSLTLRLPKTEE